MTINIVLSLIIALTGGFTFVTYRRLLRLRNFFNAGKEFPKIYNETFRTFFIALGCFQPLLFSTAYEVVSYSPLMAVHIVLLFAQIGAVFFSAQLHLRSLPYVLNMDTLRQLQAIREKKAARRREQR